MSVYVDRLPDCCDMCVCNDDYWRCGINGEDISHDGRREDCPLKVIVHCKDCRWYDPPHIQYNDGTRENVDEDAEWVTTDIGTNIGGKCIAQHKIYCTAHDRENPDDYEEIVMFRSPDDFCSYGERKEEKQVTGNSEETSTTSKTETVDTDTISRQAIEYHTQLEARGNGQYEEVEVAYKSDIESLPPVEPKPVCEDAISRSDTLKAMCAECDVKCEDGVDKEAYCTEYALVKGMPPVEPERPKGEWVSCSEPPKDRRNVFIAHGTNDFKSCCIGHYEQGMGWYEDRNFFAKPIYDCKYWCDIPELPDLGNNQFGTEVSADMRGDSE